MSRIGRAPIAIPAGVEIKVEDNNVVTVKGPKGTLTQQFNPNMAIAIVSTSKGVMTDKAARAAHVGGEVLAFVW